MKQVIIAFCLLLNLQMQAKQWNINNQTTTSSMTLYQALKSDKVQAGDTLFIENSNECFRSIQLNKCLVFIARNASGAKPGFQQVVFNSGSEGSVFENVYFRRVTYNVTKQTIKFRNCHIEGDFSMNELMFQTYPKEKKRKTETIITNSDALAEN